MRNSAAESVTEAAATQKQIARIITSKTKGDANCKIRIPFLQKRRLATTNNMLLTASHIRYLLALKKLNHSDGVKSTDIAKELEFTKPSIHNMMTTFLAMNYVKKEPRGRVYLTEYGLQKAEFLEDYYLRIKGTLFVNHKTDDTADRAICAFLAELSEESLTALDARI